MSRRKRFSDEEFKRIVECHFEGVSNSRIAKSFSTSPSHINGILRGEKAKYIFRSLWRAEKMHRALD